MHALKYLFVLLCATQTLFAAQSLLEHSDIYVDDANLSFAHITAQHFESYDHSHISFGFRSDITLWIRLLIANNTDAVQHKLLEIDNPLLETLTLYDTQKEVGKKGLLERQGDYMYPVFNLHLTPHTTQTYYLKLHNNTTMLAAGVTLFDEKEYLKVERSREMNVVLFTGLLGGLLAYALLLFLYTRDRSYLLYALYLATLLFHQLTYIGFTPFVMPVWFNAFDAAIVVPKISAMIITAAVFAQNFLKTRDIPMIYRGYWAFIIVLLIQMPLFGTPYLYLPEVSIVIGLLFIAYNLGAGLYMYTHGNKQARFFIAGWVVLIAGFFLVIIDALGLVTIMHHFPNLILWLTVLEALFLLLAFVDKLSILQQQKEAYERRFIGELEARNAIIENEVSEQTRTLKNLYQELHHRVKNNLQIILSIIRMQRDRLENDAAKESFSALEGRINSIAKTHEMLLQNENEEHIDMGNYLEALCQDIRASLGARPIRFEINAAMAMPLRQSVYVGLIVNELISNALKHASDADTITVSLGKTFQICTLHVSDNGTAQSSISKSSLGLKLVHALVEEQLEGEIRYDASNMHRYEIEFAL